MNYYIIHPLKQMIVRKDVMYDDIMVLDQLNNDLSYKCEKAKTSISDKAIKFINSVAGQTGYKGRKKIPETGWVKIKKEKDKSLEELWKMAMEKVGKEDFIL